MNIMLLSPKEAYALGEKSAKNGGRVDENPYPSTELELRCWWAAGFNDYKLFGESND